MIKKHNVERGMDGSRLDVYISKKLDITRSFVKGLVDNKNVRINSKLPKKAGERVSYKDIVEVDIKENKEIKAISQDIPINVVFEDDFLVVVDKPAGMVTHPAPGNYTGTLVNALLFHVNKLSSINNDNIRPGIVHRLDKDTSGLLVVAKTDDVHIDLSNQIKEKKAKRIYRAICVGVIKNDKGIVDANIARDPNNRKKMAVCSKNKGREAITNYKVIERLNAFTYVEFELKTGRTHQIRVHSRHIGHPIWGDKIYGYNIKNNDKKKQMLHSYHLEFDHPHTKQKMKFTSELPEYFKKELILTKKVY